MPTEFSDKDDDIFDDESLEYQDKEKPIPYAAIAACTFVVLALGWLFLSALTNAIALNEEPAIDRLAKANQVRGRGADTNSDDPLRRRNEQYLHEGQKIKSIAETITTAINHGLQNNPHNLKNVEDLEYLNLNHVFVGTDTIHHIVRGKMPIDGPAERARYSLFDVIDSNTYTKAGKPAGRVSDVIIKKSDGITTAIIRDQKGFYARNLKTLKFTRASYDEINQKTNLSLLRTIDFSQEKRKYAKPEFNENEYISIRNLRGGLTRNVENEVIGQIIAVTYENEKAKDIQFKLNPTMLSKKKIDTFALPHNAVTIVKNKNGNDIKLTKTQVEALKY